MMWLLGAMAALAGIGAAGLYALGYAVAQEDMNDIEQGGE